VGETALSINSAICWKHRESCTTSFSEEAVTT
jgi:hypothetical protein